jgi:hypothetical protein
MKFRSNIYSIPIHNVFHIASPYPLIHNLKKFFLLFKAKSTFPVRKDSAYKIWPGLPTYRMGFCVFLKDLKAQNPPP